jgi:hypothetical protein
MSFRYVTASEAELRTLSAREHHVSEPMLRAKLTNGEVLVARKGATLLGSLRFGFFWDRIPFMDMLSVEEPCRCPGTGKGLVDPWETRLAQQGHACGRTSTLAEETAQHFCRKLGYRDAGALLLPGEAPELLFLEALSAGWHEQHRSAASED